LDDVPNVERIHLEMTELLFGNLPGDEGRPPRSLGSDRKGGR